MRWSVFGIMVIATALLIFAGPLGAQAPSQPDWKESFRLHDKNGDGRMDRAEFQDWMVDAYYFRDAGHKGYLTQVDLKDTLSPEVFKAINRKGDGKLSMQEYLNALFQDFNAIDAGGKGWITIDDIQTYIRKGGR